MDIGRYAACETGHGLEDGAGKQVFDDVFHGLEV